MRPCQSPLWAHSTLSVSVIAQKEAFWVQAHSLCLLAGHITALCLFLHLHNDYENTSPTSIGLQLELSDLMYEKSLEPCPVSSTRKGNGGRHYCDGPSLEDAPGQDRAGHTHLSPWMGLLLTVCHSADPASRE